MRVVEEKIILKWILKQKGVRVWSGLIRLWNRERRAVVKTVMNIWIP
jgi:hypothetical protein